MPTLVPFRGVRYSAAVDLGRVIAPPYDVVDHDEHAALEQSHQHNAVRLILPRGGADRYERASQTLGAWQSEGVLTSDPTPRLYSYRMTFETETGSIGRTRGVIGALELPERPGAGDILPHERTLPKARSDRLALLRATRANLDPIWGLSLATGLTEALGDFRADARAHDIDGTLHELAVIDQPGQIDAIQALVEEAPMVLADGHHRFETACTYRDEHADDPGASAIMAFVVELADDELCVRAIHRLLSGVHDLRDRLTDAFDVEPIGSINPEAGALVERRLGSEDVLGLVDTRGLVLLHPRTAQVSSSLAGVPEPLRDIDAARFDALIRPHLDGVSIEYRNGVSTVVSIVEKGGADAAVLLRPVSVAQIRRAAFEGLRMPEKTTFFYPKPRTGMVFRSLDS